MSNITVSNSLARGLVDYASKQGVSRKRLLRAAKTPVSRLEDPDGRLPLEQYIHLIKEAQNLSNDAALMLRHGADVGMADVSIVGLIMEASSTMGEAFAQMQRLGRIATDIDAFRDTPRFELEPRRGKLFMVDRWHYQPETPELVESSFARLVCGPRRFLKQPHVLAAHFRHAQPDYVDVYQEVFQCPVYFSTGENSLEIHPDIASWPVSPDPVYAQGLLSRHAQKLIDQLDSEQSLSTQIESIIIKRLHTGTISVDEVAHDFNMTRQTLARKLKEEGFTYTEVLLGLRKKLAKEYLLEQNLTVAETSYLLGFSDPAAFSRAFKRWSGKSPAEFRAGN